MNLIEEHLKKVHFLDLADKKDKAAQEAKLEYFYQLFVDLEKKYEDKLEDVRKLEATHKAELANVTIWMP